MTFSPHVRTSPADFDMIRESLRARAGSTVRLGDHLVRLTCEPLLRRTAGGALEQPIKVESPVPVSAVRVSDAAGGELVRDVEVTATGLRVFVPEVSEPVGVELTLPELSADVAVVELTPVRKWHLHLVHHTHLDIGYTDPQGRVLAEHMSYLDSVLRLVKETDDWADDDARFRWSVEALWTFERWAANRPAHVVAEFVEQVRRGRIELTALPYSLHTETCATDELHELLRLAGETRRRFDVKIEVAMQTDVPGTVVGMVDALTDSGISRLSVAHNWAGRSVPHLTGAQDVPRLFWWQSPAAKRVLVWVTDTPHGLAYQEGPMVGLHESYDAVEDLLPPYLAALAKHPYPYDGDMFGFACADVPLHREPYGWDLLHLRVQGSLGDNSPPRRVVAETVRRWNEKWAYPRLRMSTNEDFFTAALQRYGDEIATFTGDWNDWWADGIGSAARPMQLARRAQGQVSDAQTISSIAGLLGADGAADDTTAAHAVYRATSLFNEHTWGSANPWRHSDQTMDSGEEQWHWKYQKAVAAHDDSGELLDRAVSRLAHALPAAEDAVASVYAVNTAGHERRGVVRAFLPESQVPVEVPLTAVDARTGKTLELSESPQVNPRHREAGRFLDIAVDEVPPVGAVRIDLTAAPAAPVATVATWGDPVLENENLRVEVDLATASIRSVYAKPLATELVRTDAAFGFNAYVYDELGSGGRINHQSGHLEADRLLSLLGRRSVARPAALVEVGRDAVRGWVTYETTAAGVERITTTLSLDHESDRLDITNRLVKQPTAAKESAYFAFPFATDGDPVVRYELTGSVGGTDLPEVPGGARHLRTIRHWLALHSGNTGIAWTSQDAALIQLGDIALPYAPFPGTTPAPEPATVYSWIHNNMWDTNFPGEQGFEMSLRYSVSAASAAAPEQACAFAARTAFAHTNPLVGVVAAAEGTAPSQVSMVRVGDDRVRVVGVTTPAPGRVLVRLQSTADTEISCPLSLGVAVRGADLATLLGEPVEPLAVLDGEITVVVGPATATACLIQVDDLGR